MTFATFAEVTAPSDKDATNRRGNAPTLALVTLAGLEPATSPAPVNKDALSPLSYSVVTIFMTVCGGAGA